MATVIKTNITEYPLNIGFFSTIGIVIETEGFSDLIHQPTGFWGKCITHDASFWCKLTSMNMAPFTPLISNIRAIFSQYIRKISGHNGSLLTSYVLNQEIRI